MGFCGAFLFVCLFFTIFYNGSDIQVKLEIWSSSVRLGFWAWGQSPEGLDGAELKARAKYGCTGPTDAQYQSGRLRAGHATDQNNPTLSPLFAESGRYLVKCWEVGGVGGVLPAPAG